MAVVGIGWNGSDEEIDQFVSRHGLTFTNVRDGDGGIFASFGVGGQPAWVFQDASGDREIVLGALGDTELSAKFADLAAAG